MDFWIKKYPHHLDHQGDQGAESNHSSYCARISFGGFVNPAEKIVQCLDTSKDIAKELNLARYHSWTDALANAKEMRRNGDHDNAEAILNLSQDGLKLWKLAWDQSLSYFIRLSTSFP